MPDNGYILFDAGLFIGPLLKGDPRHSKAHALVETAREGELLACTTVGILSFENRGASICAGERAFGRKVRYPLLTFPYLSTGTQASAL